MWCCSWCRFQTAHIWACPPSEGDDYIFHCHPPEQKIPKPKRLQDWYRRMLDKAIADRVVCDYKVNVNVWCFFMPHPAVEGRKHHVFRLSVRHLLSLHLWSVNTYSAWRSITLLSGQNLMKLCKKIIMVVGDHLIVKWKIEWMNGNSLWHTGHYRYEVMTKLKLNELLLRNDGKPSSAAEAYISMMWHQGSLICDIW